MKVFSSFIFGTPDICSIMNGVSLITCTILWSYFIRIWRWRCAHLRCVNDDGGTNMISFLIRICVCVYVRIESLPCIAFRHLFVTFFNFVVKNLFRGPWTTFRNGHGFRETATGLDDDKYSFWMVNVMAISHYDYFLSAEGTNHNDILLKRHFVYKNRYSVEIWT